MIKMCYEDKAYKYFNSYFLKIFKYTEVKNEKKKKNKNNILVYQPYGYSTGVKILNFSKRMLPSQSMHICSSCLPWTVKEFLSKIHSVKLYQHSFYLTHNSETSFCFSHHLLDDI